MTAVLPQGARQDGGATAPGLERPEASGDEPTQSLGDGGVFVLYVRKAGGE